MKNVKRSKIRVLDIGKFRLDPRVWPFHTLGKDQQT